MDMFNYRKRLFYPLHTEKPDPEFARILLDGYGGKDGELTSIAQYLAHRPLMPNRCVRELYGLIAAEELSHLEIIGAAILKLEGKLGYTNSRGKPWRTLYVEEATSPLEILEIDIALERRASDLYRRQLQIAGDGGIKKLLNFLIAREEVHKKLLLKAQGLIEREAPQDQFNELIYDYRMSLQVLE